MRSVAERQSALKNTLITTAAVLAGLGLLYALLGSDNGGDLEFGEAREPRGYYVVDATLTQLGEDGRPRMVLIAETVEQVRSDQSVRLSQLKLDYQSEQSGLWVVTANSGYMPRDQGSLSLQGDVIVRGEVEEDSAVIHTDRLTYDANASRIYTDDAVAVHFGQHELHGLGLRVDLNAGELRLESNVNGLFLP